MEKYVKRYKKKHKTNTKKELDKELVYKLATIGCTNEEIAVLAKCSRDCLERNCRHELDSGRAVLKKSIKRTQLEVALKERDRGMLIWVGKQYAGQREKQETEITGEGARPQIVFYSDDKPKPFQEVEYDG